MGDKANLNLGLSPKDAAVNFITEFYELLKKPNRDTTLIEFWNNVMDCGTECTNIVLEAIKSQSFDNKLEPEDAKIAFDIAKQNRAYKDRTVIQ